MSELGPLELIWTTAAPTRVREQLTSLGLVLRADGRFAAPPVAIGVVEDPAAPADSLAVGEPLAAELDAVAGTAGPRLAALGWATVDPKRFADELGRDLVGEPVRMPSLGADATRVAAAADRPGAITLILLEPITEGRIAATLVRHGEGPIALFLEGVAATPDDAFASASTPLGRSGQLLRPAQPSGPFIVALHP